MPDLGKAYVQIVPSAEGISGKLEEIISPEANKAGQAAGESVGKQLGSFAKKAVVALGVGKVIGDSISNGMNFETAMAKASTLFTGTSSELKTLQSDIMRISSETGVAAEQLAEAAYSAESASVPMGNLGGMIEASAKLATAGFTDIDTALSATAKTMNAYGMVSDDVNANNAAMEKVQRILIQTQNKGITTVGELGASLANVTPTAAAANVSFEQVGAALALMTAQGTPTAQATTQLRSAIAELEKEGTKASMALEQAAEGTEYAGMSFVEMMDSGADLGDVMGMLGDYADKSGVSMLDLWSSIEGGNAALAIAKDVGVFDEDLKSMATDADVVGEAYGSMADTVSFKMEQIKTSLQNMGIEAFSAVADDLAAGLEGLQTIFETISPALSELGGAFMETGGAAIDTISDFLGIDDGLSTTEKTAEVLKTAIEGLTSVLKFASDNMNTIVPIATALGGAFMVMKSPIPGIVGSLGGLVGKLTSTGTAASTATAPVASAATSFGTFAGQSLKMVAAAAALWITAQAIQTLVNAAIQIASAGGLAIGVLAGMAVGIGALMAVAGAVGPAMTAGAIGFVAFGASMLMIGGAIDLASAGIAKIIDAVGRLVETISSNSAGITAIIDSISASFDSAVTTISDGITKVIDSISGGLSSVLDSLAGVFDSIGNAALNAGTGFGQLADAVINLVQNTGVVDLASTLAATAKGVKDITSAASEAGKGAAGINQLGTSLGKLTTSSKNVSASFKTFSSSIKSTMTSAGSAIKNADLNGKMRTMMTKVVSTAKEQIRTLQAAFSNTTFSFNQHIALPHFAMSGKFDAKTGSVPTVRVSGWYAKAAEMGALFTQPTIIGVGDANQGEVLLGEKKLRELAGGGNGITINLNYDASDDANDMVRDLARNIRRYRMAGAI